MKIRIKYKRSTGSTGEFSHPLPSRVNPNNSQEVDQFVYEFVKKINSSNEPISWHFLDKSTTHQVKKPKQKTQTPKPSNYAVVSKKARVDPSVKDEHVRQRKVKKYEQQRLERRKLQNKPGDFLIVETPSEEVSTGVYKFMRKHHIPHSYTSKKCTWYEEGIHTEYRIEDADPNDVADAIYYLQGFDPQVLTFDKEYRS